MLIQLFLLIQIITPKFNGLKPIFYFRTMTNKFNGDSGKYTYWEDRAPPFWRICYVLYRTYYISSWRVCPKLCVKNEWNWTLQFLLVTRIIRKIRMHLFEIVFWINPCCSWGYQCSVQIQYQVAWLVLSTLYNGYVEGHTLSMMACNFAYLSIIAVLLLESACDLLFVARPWISHFKMNLLFIVGEYSRNLSKHCEQTGHGRLSRNRNKSRRMHREVSGAPSLSRVRSMSKYRLTS